MSPSLVLGRIPFLNCFPLYWRLKEEEGLTLKQGVPTQLNQALCRGEIDMAPISSIAYAHCASSLLLLPSLSISAYDTVDSIAIFSNRPMDAIRSIAVTPHSATSVALLRILFTLRYHRSPYIEPLTGTPAEAFASDHDAVLLIGDEALAAQGDPTVPHCIDLASEWYEWQGLPMVFAVWAVYRPSFDAKQAVVSRAEAALLDSLAQARANPGELSRQAAQCYPFTAEFIARYLQKLRYDCNEELCRGLLRFYELCAQLRLLKEVPALCFTDGSRLSL